VSISYGVYIVDEDFDTHEFVASFTDERAAYRKAEDLRGILEEDGDEGYRVEVIEEDGA
jgi:hypothetical protein